MSKKSIKGPMFMTKTSEESSKISTNRVAIRINKIQTSKIYQGFYFVIYYWLALNDQFRLIFVGKNGDIPFLVFTILCLIIFGFDILCRSIAETGYFFRFFFFVDIASIFFIAWSSFVTDISVFIVLSFMKIIMIVKVTELVITYKQWARKRLVNKVIAIKRQMMKHDKKKSSRGGPLGQAFGK